MKLKHIVSIPVKIKVKTGLHIGGNSDNIKIGGVDREIIKAPCKVYNIRNEEKKIYDIPYIPGSSLKGKLRSLLELTSGVEFNEKYGEFEIADYNNNEIKKICKYFGYPSNVDINEPIRLRFEDLYPNEDTIEKWEQLGIKNGIEVKVENSIDRITSKAKNPRYTERVIPESEFEGKIIVRVFSGDVEDENGLISNELKELLKRAKRLLEGDYLGGDGSRGYGRVEINFDFNNITKVYPIEDDN